MTTLKKRFKKLPKLQAVQLLAIVTDLALTDTYDDWDKKTEIKEAIEIWADCNLEELRC